MDLLTPQARSGIANFVKSTSIVPINDLKGAKPSNFVEGETLLRCKLASLYRLVDLCGWTHGIYNHISARVPGGDDHFLLNPFGMLYCEITASSLIKVDRNGNVVNQGSSPFGPSKAGFTLHSALHDGRPEVNFIVHIHHPSVIAVSAMKQGLLPISQEAAICGEVGYHDYQGILIDEDERKKLVQNIGPKNKILILRNHGAAICGETAEESFHLAFNLVAACETQVKAIQVGLDNIVIPNEEATAQAQTVGNKGAGGVDQTGRKWEPGQLEFEALMRAMDNCGYRTGYDFKLLPVSRNGTDSSV